jgi:maleate isomerase
MGWRARIGLVYPDDSDADDEYAAMVPPGVSVHVARNTAPWDGDVIASVLRQRSDGLVDAAARSLEPVRPDAIAYACSSGSFAGGPSYHLQIVEDLERILGVPATTGTTACDVALRTLGARDLSVVTPYESTRNDILIAVLEAQGYRVQALESFDAHGALPEFQRIGLGLVDVLNPDVAYRLGRRADRPGSDAVLIACTSFRTRPMIEPLEADLGKPVVTANQAVMWHALRLAGVAAPLDGLGVLFRQAGAAPIARSSTRAVASQA